MAKRKAEKSLLEKSLLERLRYASNALVTLDDGCEAVLLGSMSRGQLEYELHLMFANGGSLNVQPERVVKIGAKMKQTPWPEPWQKALDRLHADVRGDNKRKATAKPLPPPSEEVGALIDVRLAQACEQRRLHRVAEIRAWRCRDTPAELVAASTTHWRSYLAIWAWLKAAEPDALLFVGHHLETSTYHADAREVKRAERRRYRHVRPSRLGDGWEWPMVLSYEAHYDWEEVVLELLEAGQKVTLVEPDREWRDEPVWKVTRYVDLETAKEAFEAERRARREECRQETIDKQIEKKGAAAVMLPGFEQEG